METILEKPGDQNLSVILFRNGRTRFTRGFVLIEDGRLSHYEWLRTGENEYKLVNHENLTVVAYNILLLIYKLNNYLDISTDQCIAVEKVKFEYTLQVPQLQI